ncbi:MAG: hypothetical protein KC493_13565 [Bacteriovoracaceae bacterium]|nr:hypothetical protein [Bacteriovoracaceae bacterium]
MKKLVLTVCVLGIIVGLTVYFTQRSDEPMGIVEGEWDQKPTTTKEKAPDNTEPMQANPSNPATDVEPVNPFLPGQKLDPTSLTEEEIEEMEEYFDRVEIGWGKRMEEFFMKEANLGEDAMEDYGQLRENYEEEKMIAYQEFHEFMVAKHGENYAYNPTEEMEIFENKVQDIYLDKLRKQLGDENYSRYLEVKDQYNDQLRKEQDPKKGVVLIEL